MTGPAAAGPVLALDTSGRGFGVAVLDPDGLTIATRADEQPRGQDQRLVPAILAALAEAGLTARDLRLIACVRGPGSFVGVRVGLAAAHGLALAGAVPVVGVDGFRVFAAQALEAGPLPEAGLIVAIDSLREDAHLQRFDAAGRLVGAPWLARPAPAPEEPLALAGSAAPAFAAAWPWARSIPDALRLDPAAAGRLALADHRAGTAAPALPLYLREPEITLGPGSPAAARGA